jgi:hypothetical protein
MAQRQVLLLDQFSGVTPFSLQENPTKFDDLVKLTTTPSERWWGYKTPQLHEHVADDFELPMASTAIISDDNGYARVWRARWDTSG